MTLEHTEGILLSLMVLSLFFGLLAKKIKLPYTIALVLCGILAGLFGFEGIGLSKELIFFLILPPLLFEAVLHIELIDLRDNLKPIILLAVPGLCVAVLLAGAAIYYLTDLPLIYALLFGSIIMATDPVSVLATFKKSNVNKKVALIVEGESIFNDATSIVLFNIIYFSITTGNGFSLTHAIIQFVFSFIGGIMVGLIAGYITYNVLKSVDDHQLEVLATIILAYGVFLVAEQLNVSGVMAVVSAGLLIGNHGKKFAMSDTTINAIVTSWDVQVFMVNTFIFLLIGMAFPLGELLAHSGLILIAIFVVLFSRFMTVEPILLLNRIPQKHINLINLGGLHGSIPIALVLGLGSLAYKTEISAMVYGVVAFSLIIQGLVINHYVSHGD